MVTKSRPIAIKPQPLRGIPFTPEPAVDPDSTHLGRLEIALSAAASYINTTVTNPQYYSDSDRERARVIYETTRRDVMLMRGK